MTERPPPDIVRAAAWLRKPESIVPSIVVLLALIMLAVSMVYIGMSNPNGFIMLGLALVPLFYHVRRTAARRRLERAAHAASNNSCPHCLYDLSGIPGAERCPECGQLVGLKGVTQSWGDGQRLRDTEDPSTWGRLTSSDMDMPQSVRICGLLAIASLIVVVSAMFVHGWTIVRAISWAAFAASALALWIGTSLHSANSWRYLEAAGFRICPRCKRNLSNGDNEATSPRSGNCPRCGIGYTPDWLERTWSIIYRKPSV